MVSSIASTPLVRKVYKTGFAKLVEKCVSGKDDNIFYIDNLSTLTLTLEYSQVISMLIYSSPLNLLFT